MPLQPGTDFPTPTLSFDVFWDWLMSHANCILRAGTPETVLYDDTDLHWHLTAENAETLLVQVIKGKRLMGELLIQPEQIAYAQGLTSEREDEHIFELVTETETERLASYFFVLAHGFEEDDGYPQGSGHVH
jgi:hypothetical protein